MPAPDFHIKQGDTSSVLTGVLEGDDGAVSIAGASLEFHMAPIAGGLGISRAATVEQVGDGSDGSLGAWSFTWQATDTATAGWYLGEVEVTFAGGQVQTFPNGGYMLIAIDPELA